MTDDRWTAVTTSAALGAKPLRIALDGAALVVFRDGAKIHALADRCPHRMVPLSGGRVVRGQIECPYHGWRFDGAGQCTAIPGHLGDLPKVRVPRYRAMEHDGGVFVTTGTPGDPPFSHAQSGGDIVARVVTSDTHSTVLDSAENILDATHTHFTHKGLLRGLSPRRHRVEVRVTGGPDWVEATYTGEPKQLGWVSQLLEGGTRTKTVGRFHAGGIVVLEYWGPKGIVLATTFHLHQATQDRVVGVGWLIGPRQGGLGHLKALAFKPMFNLALRQDQKVLSAASENARAGGRVAPVIGPLDFLRADIAAILDGRPPSAYQTPRHHVLEL